LQGSVPNLEREQAAVRTQCDASCKASALLNGYPTLRTTRDEVPQLNLVTDHAGFERGARAHRVRQSQRENPAVITQRQLLQRLSARQRPEDTAARCVDDRCAWRLLHAR